MEYIFERTINYYETDRMGIVHHSNYIRFLEEARCKFLDDIGLPYLSFENNQIMIPVLGVSCEYKHHVTFNDTIIIKSKISEFTGVRMTVSYTIIDKETNNLVATATTKHCFTNTQLKPISLKKYYFEAYEKLKNLSEKSN